MSLDPDGLMAITSAEIDMFQAEKSGFSCDLNIASSYWLGGPVIGAGITELAVGTSPSVDSAVRLDEVTALVRCLDPGPIKWAAATFDDGSICLASSRGASYIPPGVYVPQNVNVLVGHAGDAVGWQLCGAAPAERLLGYALRGGWLGRMTSVVAGNVRTSGTSGSIRWADPFERVAPVLGGLADHVALIGLGGQQMVSWSEGRRWPWGFGGRGGRHRFEVVCPDRYAQLCEQVRGGMAGSVIARAAERTVAAGREALNDVERVLGPWLLAVDPDARAAVQVLRTVAAADPAVVAQIRCADIESGSGCGGDCFGLPSHVAPGWAGLADRGYRRASLCGVEGFVADAAWEAFERRADRPSDLAVEYGCWLRVLAALEAALFWSADPLPIADIEYATWMALG